MHLSFVSVFSSHKSCICLSLGKRETVLRTIHKSAQASHNPFIRKSLFLLTANRDKRRTAKQIHYKGTRLPEEKKIKNIVYKP